MKYYVLSTVFGEGKGRHIETKKNIEELITESANGLIELKDGSFIGVDLLRIHLSKLIRKRRNIIA